MYFCMKFNSHFLFKIISKYIPKCINRKCFQKVSSRELPNSKRVSKIFIFYTRKWYFKIFYIKNGSLKKIKFKIWSKYTPKRSKLHHLKKFGGGGGGGAYPQTLLAKRIIMASKSVKKKFSPPPPPPNPGYAPATYIDN